MLYEFGMPTAFWGKALAAFIHTSNRSFTSALPEMTPHEAFLGSKPDLSMLRVWGCTAYVLIQRDKRPLGSLGTHMEKCEFIGYPSGYKGWKFYSPGSKKVVISERADFDECYFTLQRHSEPHLPPPHPDTLLETPGMLTSLQDMLDDQVDAPEAAQKPVHGGDDSTSSYLPPVAPALPPSPVARFQNPASTYHSLLPSPAFSPVPSPSPAPTAA